MDGVYIHIRDEHASDGGLEGLCLMQATLTEKADLEQIDPPEIGLQLSEFNNLFSFYSNNYQSEIRESVSTIWCDLAVSSILLLPSWTYTRFTTITRPDEHVHKYVASQWRVHFHARLYSSTRNHQHDVGRHRKQNPRWPEPSQPPSFHPSCPGRKQPQGRERWGAREHWWRSRRGRMRRISSRLIRWKRLAKRPPSTPGSWRTRSSPIRIAPSPSSSASIPRSQIGLPRLCMSQPGIGILSCPSRLQMSPSWSPEYKSSAAAALRPNGIRGSVWFIVKFHGQWMMYQVLHVDWLQCWASLNFLSHN